MEHDKDFEILTDRLLIRVPTIKDAQAINAAMNEVWHELQLWMSWAHHGENTLEKTRTYLQTAMERSMLPLAGFCRNSGKFVVSSGITFHLDGRRETGYWVAKEFLGKGYATEATEAVLRHGFEQMNLERFFITHYEGNDKSRRIIEKLGFTKIGVIEKGHARCLDGTLLDEHQYEITRQQWRERCL